MAPDLKIQYNNDIEQLKKGEGMSYVLSTVREEVEKTPVLATTKPPRGAI